VIRCLGFGGTETAHMSVAGASTARRQGAGEVSPEQRGVEVSPEQRGVEVSPEQRTATGSLMSESVVAASTA